MPTIPIPPPPPPNRVISPFWGETRKSRRLRDAWYALTDAWRSGGRGRYNAAVTRYQDLHRRVHGKPDTSVNYVAAQAGPRGE